MTPTHIAAQVLSIDAAHLHATRIKGGLTNESWCVQGPRDAVVVRISTADEQALQLNRASEAVVLNLVQQADIGAQVLFCAPEQRLLVTRQLHAQTLTVEQLLQTSTLKQVAALLRRLHALPVATGVQPICFTTILQRYWQSMAGDADAASSALRAQALSIADESDRVAQRCLCHNDVHHLNLMADGKRLWLLDWEYAGIGDPWFDLASVCCYHGYDECLRQELLIAYRGEWRVADAERLQRMCWLFNYIQRLWLAVRNLNDNC